MVQTFIIIAVLSFITVITSIYPPHKLNNYKTDSYVFSFDFTNCLRGVAILLVMVGHVSATMNTVIFSPLGGTGVALFLLLSGFGLNESFKTHGLSCYWRKKSLRVLMPYFSVATVLYICRWEFSWGAYLLDITGLKTHYWYIAFLIKWYIAFWITSKFFLRYRTAILLAMSTAILFLFPNIEAEQAFSFPVGVFISIHLDKAKNLSSKNIMLIVCMMFLVGTAFLLLKQHPAVRELMHTWIYNVVQLFIKLPYAISLVCVLMRFPACINSKFLLLSGVLCYELYLFHMPFYSYLDGSVWLAFLLFVISFTVCYPFNLLNKKIMRILS